jgi:hypothetical protein
MRIRLRGIRSPGHAANRQCPPGAPQGMPLTGILDCPLGPAPARVTPAALAGTNKPRTARLAFNQQKRILCPLKQVFWNAERNPPAVVVFFCSHHFQINIVKPMSGIYLSYFLTPLRSSIELSWSPGGGLNMAVSERRRPFLCAPRYPMKACHQPMTQSAVPPCVMCGLWVIYTPGGSMRH